MFLVFVCISGLGIFLRYKDKVEREQRIRQYASEHAVSRSSAAPVVLSSNDLANPGLQEHFFELRGKAIQIEADVVQRVDSKTWSMTTFQSLIDLTCEYDSNETPEGDSLKAGQWLTVTGTVTEASGFTGVRTVTMKWCRFTQRTEPLDHGWEMIHVNKK